jgi:hypothetical protein
MGFLMTGSPAIQAFSSRTARRGKPAGEAGLRGSPCRNHRPPAASWCRNSKDAGSRRTLAARAYWMPPIQPPQANISPVKSEFAAEPARGIDVLASTGLSRKPRLSAQLAAVPHHCEIQLPPRRHYRTGGYGRRRPHRSIDHPTRRFGRESGVGPRTG